MILVIDHFDSFSHNLFQLLAAQGQEVRVERCDRMKCSDIQAWNPDLIILSPGPKGPKDTGVTLELLASDWAQKKAIVGVCLGFQALALMWGARVELAPEVVHGKTLMLETVEHPIFKDLPRPLQVARYDSLCVPTQYLPEHLLVLGQHAGMAMAVLDRQRPWLGLQFHPESFLTPRGPALLLNIQSFLSSLPKD